MLFVKFMRRCFMNFAVGPSAFILGTLAATVVLMPENADEILSQSRRQYESRRESPIIYATAERRETEAGGAGLFLTDSADQPKEIKSGSRYPIIEIWEKLDGSVPIRGEFLYFRMFDDGTAEFDYESRKENESGKPRYIFSVERASRARISEGGFRRLKSLSEDLTKSRSLKREYKPVALTLDVISKLTVLLKADGVTNRKIIINDSDFDVMNESLEKKFPNSLVKLIKEVHLMRVELQEKERPGKSPS